METEKENHYGQNLGLSRAEHQPVRLLSLLAHTPVHTKTKLNHAHRPTPTERVIEPIPSEVTVSLSLTHPLRGDGGSKQSNVNEANVGNFVVRHKKKVMNKYYNEYTDSTTK